MVFNKLRIQLHRAFKKAFLPRDAEKRFVNPYAMSDTTTSKFHVKPQFKDGRFILDPEHNPYSKKEKKKNDTKEKAPAEKKKEPGFSKACIDVIISDIEYISGETRRKAKQEIISEEEARKHFMDLIAKGKNPLPFVRKPEVQPIIQEPTVVSAPAVEPEIVTQQKHAVNPVDTYADRSFDPVIKMLRKYMITPRKKSRPVVVEEPFVDEPIIIVPDVQYDVAEVYKRKVEDDDEWLTWEDEKVPAGK